MVNTYVVSLLSILIGVVATIFVTRHYYRRSTEKSLTPYLQFSTSVFRGVDPAVQEALKISYKGVPVKDLLEIQFLIANTGFRPIRDLIDPLSLKIPKQCEVLDATLLHVHPEGRDIRIHVAATEVELQFPLLNADEFFIVKLLVKGEARPKDWKFTVTADDLPPTLGLKRLTPDLINTTEDRRFEWGALAAGLVVSLLAAALCSLIYGQLPAISSLWNDGVVDGFKQHWLMIVSAGILTIPALLLLVTGPMLLIGAFTDFSFPRRRRFTIPTDYRRHMFYIRAPRSAIVDADWPDTDA